MPAAKPSGDLGVQDLVKADRDGVITEWGSDFERTFGYSADEAVGQQVSLIIPPALQAMHWRGFDKAMARGRLKRDGKTIKVPAIHQSGAVRAVNGRLSLVKNQGGVVDAVQLKLVGEGPRWAPPLWRVVLSVLGAGQSLAKRVRP